MAVIRHDIALAVLVVGCAAIVLSALGQLATRGTYQRLHFAGPATTLGAPLVVVALALDGGPAHAIGKEVLAAVVVGVTGPIVSAAIARAERVRGRST